VLGAAGPNCRIADPLTLPEQAGLAAAGRWGALKAQQDSLIGGRRVVVRSTARTAMSPSTSSTGAWQILRRVCWTLAAAVALVLLADRAPQRLSCRAGRHAPGPGRAGRKAAVIAR
jgi:hypothetical protein